MVCYVTSAPCVGNMFMSCVLNSYRNIRTPVWCLLLRSSLQEVSTLDVLEVLV